MRVFFADTAAGTQQPWFIWNRNYWNCINITSWLCPSWGRPLMHFDLDTCFNLWQLIEKQHWFTSDTSTLLLPFLPSSASFHVSRFMRDSGLHILHSSSCQSSRNRRSHLRRLLHSLIACNMIINAYFKHGMLFRYGIISSVSSCYV